MNFTCSRICYTTPFISLIFLALLIFSSSFALEWIVDDAVYITAEIETRSPDEENRPQGERLPGKCIKFKDCYPIFFLTDNKEESDGKPALTSINSDLVDFILETTEHCSPDTVSLYQSSFNTSKEDTYIWCRLRDVSDSEISALSKNRKHNGTDNNTGVEVLKGVRAESKAMNEENCGYIPNQSKPQQPDEAASGPEERVVGGKDLVFGDAPYSVAMIFREKQVCGASIIDEQHVLTAAHCVSHMKPTVLQYVRLLIGDHNIKDPSDTDHQVRNVSKVIYHKEFSKDTLHDDIAMIKMSSPIEYTNTVGAVCLSDGSQSYDDGTSYGKLVGWGQLSDGGERPNTPKTAQLRIWRSEDCEEMYEGVVPDDIFEKAICAGGFQDGGTTDACRGDSGGPLTVVNNNRNEQVGIVSFGVGCGRYPGVFTKVSEYQSWIDRHRVF